MIETLNNLTTDQLKARLYDITQVITLLNKIWNKPTMSFPDMVAIKQIQLPDWKEQFKNGKGIYSPYDMPTLKQFIHNFCTNLCAEKLLIESLLSEKL